jgi:hypothetical protein
MSGGAVGLGFDPSPTEPGRPIWSGWTSWAQPIVFPFGYISLENKII